MRMMSGWMESPGCIGCISCMDVLHVYTSSAWLAASVKPASWHFVLRGRRGDTGMHGRSCPQGVSSDWVHAVCLRRPMHMVTSACCTFTAF